ncbi:hypothetical protein PVAND_009401 [Polypedilum vanderplanki]|uniref:Uncharacterized protein n=1 Tax=Polypedilum vanderplanki TaxID=319348 RepID=A0A9J6CDE9_POLVA|nr:hypothetical protein PVAND_009401 [Polypedilum vanderplanki]
MKCSACLEKKCKRKYKNRNECVGKNEDIDCSCLCQVTLKRTIIVTSLSVIFGCAIVFGGAFLMAIYNDNIYLVIIGDAIIIGFGCILVGFSLKKLHSGDRMSLSNTFQGVFLKMFCPKYTYKTSSL